MAVPMLDLSAENGPLKDELRAAFDAILDTNQFILGKAVDAFEKALASYCGVEHAIGISSGTDALLVALMALEIGPGDEVLCPTFTFFATAGVVHRVGATPVFVDIDPATFNIDVAAAEAAITERTKAIIPVHLFGRCADMTAVSAMAARRGIEVIEDAAQSIGAKHGDRTCGSIGRVGCLSFYPTKNLGGVGDSGAVLTNDADLAQRIRQLRLHGQTDEYRHEYVGGNFRIDGLQAAAMSVKLPHLDGYTAGRRAAASRYADLLADTPLTLPADDTHGLHVFNQYTVRAPQREGLMQHLKATGIGHKVYYPLPLHLQPCFAYLGYEAGRLPAAEAASREVVSLPMFPTLTAEQQRETAAAIAGFYGSAE
ncbi:MAG: aminotransferase class I/II-fold pyridoxal phosphate-dependent enzyme [Phycisphaera sp.]|nr:aminotransferase class I/II-fold pyridoxal phosphate-dependent enzyme [Phycisphaera sp.]